MQITNITQECEIKQKLTSSLPLPLLVAIYKVSSSLKKKGILLLWYQSKVGGSKCILTKVKIIRKIVEFYMTPTYKMMHLKE